MFCDCCGREIDCYCNWHGKPFSVQATREICLACVCVLKPITVFKNETPIDIIGSYSGDDIRSLSELIEDGFEIKRATHSIKKVAQMLNIPPNIVKLRLKK